ncbi:acyltransferase [Aquabacterium sp. NJ1]|uniref:acyltransferase family protein n=1 Tax=Aquabacterium sp. NJ1 TaxID=1538295 RepID=UPI00126A702E|nr:acyltransferase [Aquabacterium sp. NJ1]
MTRPSHLPSLDGIRGLAILMVIAHNVQLLDVPEMHGAVALAQLALNIGWIGVQLFFVLSGFLITGILLDSVGQPHGLRNFIARRALRIFPLYYGALVLIFVLLPLLGAQPEMYKAQAPYQIWLWVYLSNWTDAMGIGPGSLPHFWSLAVEEQFYLLWPLLVFSLRTPQRVAVMCALVSIISLLCRMALYNADANHRIVYEWTICRMDALALGGLAATCWRVETWRNWIAAHRRQLAWALLLLLTSSFLWTHAFPRATFRSMTEGYTVLAIGFAAWLYLAANHDALAATGGVRTPAWHRALRNPVLQSVGKYSYGMYVIHKPLHDLFSADVLARMGVQTEGHILNACLHVLAVTLISYAAAWLTYHLYEVHFLRLKRHFA